MNTETRHLLSEYLLNEAEDARLDNNDLMELYEAMEDSVWGVFQDWANEEWEAADVKLLRINHACGSMCAAYGHGASAPP